MDLDAFTELLTPRGQRALAEAGELQGGDPVAAATSLRRTYDAALASAALTQARLRDRARAKFGADAELMYFTPHGLEQATRAEVAAHRAARLTALWHDSHRSQGPRTRQGAAAREDDTVSGTRPQGPHDSRPHDSGPHDSGPHGSGPHGSSPHGSGPQDFGPPCSGTPGSGTQGAGPRVVDACCGIGGDLLALARAGCVVDAVDTDPLTVAVARANVEALGPAGRVTVRVADAASVSPEDYDVLFADPARRTSRGRTFDPLAYSPPWPVVLDLVARARWACLKVAPGIPYEFIPETAEAEWVSYKGEVKEASLWTHPGARTTDRPDTTAGGGPVRLATLLPGGHVLRDTGAVAPVGPLGRYVYEPDGAAIRAHLVAEVAELVDGRLPDPMIAYITGDDPVDTSWASRYEVEEALPFSLKRLRAALRDRKIGNITIKKRASAVDIERLRGDLRLSGSESAVVILTRIMGKPSALICRPCPPA
ncbi:methyltransferase domain-containing protein [Nonomuraea sp. 3-1Str]|uniref:class I SAM-dependent methyltransferase n=1 Tax=Nonomuraea sp. 3-1Str TaxID=2929801 RepID=UPI0028670D2E|nr:methyltransferase domain-containing protein [Nonomuraea sp. 3-1Str]MDR8408757.1 methyltransferase domain-containing protein [Nonomuraea sp. 3-1Str]